MTPHQENLKTVEAAVRKACPETMELRFGCIFCFHNGPKGVIVNSPEWKYADFMVFWRGLQPKFDSMKRKDFESKAEILGSPLGLEHVLRALDKSQKAEGVSINRSGKFTNILYDVSGREERYNDTNYPIWFLTKPLFDQDEPTIAFLAKLLKP